MHISSLVLLHQPTKCRPNWAIECCVVEGETQDYDLTITARLLGQSMEGRKDVLEKWNTGGERATGPRNCVRSREPAGPQPVNNQTKPDVSLEKW